MEGRWDETFHFDGPPAPVPGLLDAAGLLEKLGLFRWEGLPEQRALVETMDPPDEGGNGEATAPQQLQPG